jgi:predicted nucleic acid-binding Zn ribbon protein
MTLRIKQIIPIIKCRVCGKRFQPKAITGKMCSQICRVKWTTDWHSNRNRINKKIRYSEAKKIKCRNCNKTISAIPNNRVFCGRICRETYKPPKKKRDKPKFIKLYSFKNFKSKKTKSSNKIDRKEIENAVKEFLKKGGEIEKLEPIKEPNLPTVGSRDWDWEVTVGLDPIGSKSDRAEPDKISVEDIISLIR